MIVRTNPDHLLLITQPDHAALSAAIMARWRRDGLPAHPRREWLLLATREHDAGWAEVDVAPIVDPASGRLLDFVHAPDAVRQEVWPRSIERLAHCAVCGGPRRTARPARLSRQPVESGVATVFRPD